MDARNHGMPRIVPRSIVVPADWARDDLPDHDDTTPVGPPELSRDPPSAEMRSRS